jgi:hypothetical protein
MSRPRIAFESHLGHGITPRQRGFCFNVLTGSTGRPSDARFAGFGLAAAVPKRVCGVAGSSPWVVLPPAVNGVAAVTCTYSWAGGAGAT